MDVITALIGIFIILMLSVYKGIAIYYPLFTGLMTFIIIAYMRGFKLNELIKMVFAGLKRSLLIISILVLIGVVTAVWRASGTVAYVVYYGLKYMNPNYFILNAFILSSIVSFLLGTSLGTVGTIGIILMVMVKGGNININIVAGAIISGAYFGDRCSPMSSSANLVAVVTDTDLYMNIKNMFRTSVIPFAVSIIFYGVLSFQNPLYLGDSQISSEILKSFNLNWTVVLPALIILILVLLRVEVKLAMLASIINGVIIAVLVQKESLADMLKYIAVGYSRPEQSFLGDIMMGGGIVSMLRVMLTILISFALSGIFEGTSLLKDVEEFVFRMGGRIGIFAAVIITSIMTGFFGCSQTLAIMLTYQLVKAMYDDASMDKYELALDIEDTVIVISALIPWNIAGAVPAATLSADGSYGVYACYLYMLPLIRLISKKLKSLSFYRPV